MQAFRVLPQSYLPHRQLDLSRRSVALALNLVALPLLALFGWLFHRLAAWLRPDYAQAGGLVQAMDSLVDLLILVAVYVILIVLHELIHGAFFWLFTRERPLFAFKGLYAFAAAPDWHIPRNQYIIVGLAPLVLISAAAPLLAAVIPVPMIPFLVLLAALNASGAVGDVFIVGWVLIHPANALVRDRGDVYDIYLPGKATP